MALPLAPVLFPDIEGPEFVKADEVADVARTVLAKHGKPGGVARLFPIAQALDGAEFSIAYLFNAKPFDPLKDEVSHDASGKCLKAPKLWQNVTGIDVAIWLREAFWREWPDDVREAAVLHELLHVDVSHDDKGFLRLAVRKHDLEDFVDVARIYGPLFGYGEGGAPAYVRAANTWADRTRKPPTPLRPLDAEALGDAIVDHVDLLQSTADKLGGDITVSANGRSATVRSRKPGAHHAGEDARA